MYKPKKNFGEHSTALFPTKTHPNSNTGRNLNVQTKKEFWRTFNSAISNQNTSEFKYWSELEFMPDGKQLWDYIKKYTPYILTAPTFNPESKEGKHVKAEYSRKNRILIDDRAATIDDWRAKGGVGILHTSAADTIEQLKQLGL